MATSEKLVFDLPLFLGAHNLNDFLFIAVANRPDEMDGDNTAQFMLVNPRIERVRVLKSVRELEDRKRAYRQEYNERETTRERMREKINNQAFKESRRQYSLQPRVIEQKRRTSALRRKATSLIQSENPDLFNRALEEALQKMTETHPVASSANSSTHSNGD